MKNIIANYGWVITVVLLMWVFTILFFVKLGAL